MQHPSKVALQEVVLVLCDSGRNFLRFIRNLFAKNCKNRADFDKDATKITEGAFFRLMTENEPNWLSVVKDNLHRRQHWERPAKMTGTGETSSVKYYYKKRELCHQRHPAEIDFSLQKRL